MPCRRWYGVDGDVEDLALTRRGLARDQEASTLPFDDGNRAIVSPDSSGGFQCADWGMHPGSWRWRGGLPQWLAKLNRRIYTCYECHNSKTYPLRSFERDSENPDAHQRQYGDPVTHTAGESEMVHHCSDRG